MDGSPAVWPVLIVRSHLLVAPDFLVEPGNVAVDRILVNEVNPGIPATTELVCKTFELPQIGRVTTSFHDVPIEGEHVGRPAAVVRDDSGRVLHMIEGVIAKGQLEGDLLSAR